MKTALRAKIVIETDIYHSYYEINPLTPELTMEKIIKHINEGNIEIEAIDDGLTNHTEPVFIIKLLPDEK